MKRVIITGATGAIGRALIEELIENQIEVLVFCREGSPRNKGILESPLVSVKYYRLDCLADIQNDTGKQYDVFYHFAWDGTIGKIRNDMYLQAMNVKYSLDAVNIAKRFGCHTFVGAGSQAEYGRVEGKLSPDTPAFPETGYGIAKLCAGQMTREMARQLDIKHVWVRILSVYGPHDAQNTMVMTTIDQIKKGIKPQFTKGEQMWDYLYSRDAAKAFRLIGEKGIDGRTYVLGSGIARPLSYYIKEIRDAINKKAELDFGAIPYSEKQVMYLCADINELTKDTGFQPRTDFHHGIRMTLERYSDEKNFIAY